MKEVKPPKKPLMYYYSIALMVLLLFNFIAVPWMAERQVKEVDYGTFMTMTEEKNIKEVEIETNQIVFTDNDGNYYKTGAHGRRRPCRASARLRRGVLAGDNRADLAVSQLPADLGAADSHLRRPRPVHV